MTKREAQATIKNHTKVEGGEGDEYDIGYIHSIDGKWAMVGWDSGVVTPCLLAEIEAV